MLHAAVGVRHDFLEGCVHVHGAPLGLDVLLHGGADPVRLVPVQERHLEAVVLVQEPVHGREHHLEACGGGHRSRKYYKIRPCKCEMKTKEDALCLPFSDNFRKLRSYILKKKIHLTVMESLSGSMKSNALAMATKTSSLMRSGMLYLSEQEEVAGVNGGEVEG